MTTREREEEGSGTVLAEREPKAVEPPNYAVILHNDHYTTMEFVVQILKQIFHKKEEEAVQIMLQVHQQGQGVAGIYHFEIAETKACQVDELARSKGFPLKCSIELTT